MRYTQVSMGTAIQTIDELLALAVALGAQEVAGWSADEEALTRGLPTAAPILVERARAQIVAGADLLGETFARLRSAEERRPLGATYTPAAIVEAMLDWAAQGPAPSRVVDPGAGSARFLVAAARSFPQARLIGVELDPTAAVLARGHLAARGLAPRATVIRGDYLTTELEPIEGPTLFIGNPPYVRHHQIAPEAKAWLVKTARQYGIAASQLAGLHTYFFLATALNARPSDRGVFITAAEWLDVNYGSALRELLTRTLHVVHLELIDPTAEPFPGTATTGVITGFEVGAQTRPIAVGRTNSTAELGAGGQMQLPRQQLAATTRWSTLTVAPSQRRAGLVELGELYRVHRGQVTGANTIWIAGPHSRDLPTSVLYPTVTRARELIAAGDTLRDARGLRRVIDLPSDLAELSPEEREAVEAFLAYAIAQGAHEGYIARNRRDWWSVGLRAPAPILATYMARRPPAFVRNLVAARHINIAHGLYPREPMSDLALDELARFLNAHVSTADGRTYAGGLTKFEPREMERLLVPRPELIVPGQSLYWDHRLADLTAWIDRSSA